MLAWLSPLACQAKIQIYIPQNLPISEYENVLLKYEKRFLYLDVSYVRGASFFYFMKNPILLFF